MPEAFRELKDQVYEAIEIGGDILLLAGPPWTRVDGTG